MALCLCTGAPPPPRPRVRRRRGVGGVRSRSRSRNRGLGVCRHHFCCDAHAVPARLHPPFKAWRGVAAHVKMQCPARVAQPSSPRVPLPPLPLARRLPASPALMRHKVPLRRGCYSHHETPALPSQRQVKVVPLVCVGWCTCAWVAGSRGRGGGGGLELGWVQGRMAGLPAAWLYGLACSLTRLPADRMAGHPG